MDIVRLTAEQRHFYTADVELAEYGRVMLIGDQDAVERLLAILGQHKNHNLRLLPPEPPSTGPERSKTKARPSAGAGGARRPGV